MFAKTAAGAVLAIIAAAMVFLGVCFASFAIFTALQPSVGVPGSAAITALILLIGPLLFVVAAAIRQPPKKDLVAEEMLLSLFTGVARKKPLLALIGAGAVGAVDIFLRRRRK